MPKYAHRTTKQLEALEKARKRKLEKEFAEQQNENEPPLLDTAHTSQDFNLTPENPPKRCRRKSDPRAAFQPLPANTTDLINIERTPTASEVYFDSLKITPKTPTTPLLDPIQKISAELPIGRRILSVSSLCSTIDLIINHNNECKQSSIEYTSETRLGLESKLKFKCTKCGRSFCFSSDTGKEALPINQGLAWGCQNGPVGFESLASMLAPMDIPCLSKPTFKKYQDFIEDDMLEAMEKNMENAAHEEKQLAIAANEFIEINGEPYPAIRVVVDGSWSKRSYGHSYDSNYGTAAVVGYKTGKVIDCRVRVKYCYFCTRYKNATKVPIHKCYKNWNQSSTAMEQDVLFECFSNSIKKYGIVYSSFIGDGDSSVHQKVKNVYPGYQVRKIECVNHIVRNLNSKLTAMSNNKVKRGVIFPQNERQYPGMEDRFRRVGKSVMSAILHYNAIGKHSENWEYLMEDILNIPYHTFGRHDKCKNYYCKRQGTEPDLIPQVELMSIFTLLKEAIGRVANLSESLIEKETSNVVESFMGVIAKFLEGKRKNLGGSNLYTLKIASAVLSFNSKGFWGPYAYKVVFGISPNSIWKKRKHQTSQRRAHALKTSKNKNPRQLNFGFLKQKGDQFYGANPKTPDLDEKTLKIRIKALRAELQVDPKRQNAIEETTRKQAGNQQWFDERQRRITASVCGTIFKLKPESDNTGPIKTILRTREISTQALKYGKDTEDIAIAKYEQLNNLEPGKVVKCGLVVSVQDGIFAASPDGLVGTDGLIEVKCPFSIRFDDPTSWPKKKSSPLKLVNGKLELSRKHSYYFQVVMQLFVTERKWCDFFVYTTVGTYTERIYWNSESIGAWNSMRRKLFHFWREDLAPEIVDSRLSRGYKDFRCSELREKGRQRKNIRKEAQLD